MAIKQQRRSHQILEWPEVGSTEAAVEVAYDEGGMI